MALLLYLAAMTWAVIESDKRWLTILWSVVAIAVSIGAIFLCSLIWPFEVGVLGHLAAPISLLISALIGINHMRGHRRVKVPKSTL